MEPTIVHRASPRSRPSRNQTSPAVGALVSRPSQAATSNSSSSKASSSNTNYAKSSKNSTGKTSPDPIPKDWDPNARCRERVFHAHHSPLRAHRNPGIGADDAGCPSPDNNNLTPIQEVPLIRRIPGIATVERAAAVKIYLETHFNQLLAAGPSPRQIRKRLLEADLFNCARERGSALPAAEFHAVRSQFYGRETDCLRETRVMKTRTLRVLASSKPTKEGSLANEYETVKPLGKGSFGVVRLVREAGSGQIYAMKVIKKSKMLMTSQEGHLRAERDILVASEGSRW